MITPPVSGEPIASPWGIAVSDAINFPPHAMLKASGQSMASNIGTLAFATFVVANVQEDTDGYFDDATDALRVPVGLAGLYRVNWTIEFAANATGQRRFSIRKTTVTYHQTTVAPGFAQPCSYSESFLLRLAEADYMQILCAQNSGANLVINNAELQLERIGE